MTATYAVDGLTARTDQLKAADIVDGLTSTTVMLLIDHLALPAHPYLAVERRQVADWVGVNGIEHLQAALVAVNAQEAAPTRRDAHAAADRLIEAEYRDSQADYDDYEPSGSPS